MPEVADRPADNGNRQQSTFETWTPGDSKLLVLTVAAAVVANIVTVILVALAVIVARSFRPHSGTLGSYAFLWGSAAFPIMTVYIAFSALRRSRRQKPASSDIRV